MVRWWVMQVAENVPRSTCHPGWPQRTPVGLLPPGSRPWPDLLPGPLDGLSHHENGVVRGWIRDDLPSPDDGRGDFLLPAKRVFADPAIESPSALEVHNQLTDGRLGTCQLTDDIVEQVCVFHMASLAHAFYCVKTK